jgi:hypothetical protein
MKGIHVGLIALALGGSIASAQFGGGGMGGGMGRGGMGGGMDRGGGMNRGGGGEASMSPEERQKRMLDGMAKQLELNSGQKKKFQSIMAGAREAASPIQEELRLGRENLIQAVREGKSEEEVGRLSDLQGTTYAKLAAVESQAMAKIFAMLDDSQKPRAAAIFGRMGGLFPARTGPMMRGPDEQGKRDRE